MLRKRLTVSAHGLGVASLPGSTVGATNGVVGAVTLDTETSVVLASGGKASSLTVLVDRVDDPVDAGIVSDGNVTGIHKDDLKVLVGSILVDPVGVQNTKVHGVSAGTLLSNTAKVAGKLQLVDTLVLGLTEHNTLGVGSLAATTANSNTQHGVALLGLVAELVGLVGSGRASHLLDLLALAVLPSSINCMDGGELQPKTTKHRKYELT